MNKIKRTESKGGRFKKALRQTKVGTLRKNWNNINGSNLNPLLLVQMIVDAKSWCARRPHALLWLRIQSNAMLTVRKKMLPT